MAGRLRPRRLLLGAVTVLVLLQLLPWGRYPDPPLQGEVALPPRLRGILEHSCYDCHSNRIRVPWYGRIAPLSWWLAADVDHGLRGVNYTAWNSYTPRQQALYLRQSLERIESGLMPPRSYLLTHPKARLSHAELTLLRAFVAGLPPDSLGAKELLAWPSRAWAGTEPVTGVARCGSLELRQPLRLQQALLLVDGDLALTAGLQGSGAVLATGDLRVEDLEGRVGAVALVALGKVDLQGRGAEMTAPVYARQALQTQGVELLAAPGFRLELPAIREIRLDFCRDDGEIGERLERSLVVRWGYGHYCLWDPEFQRVEWADDVGGALQAAERLLGAAPSTRTGTWERRYRKDWERLLRQLPERGEPACLLWAY